MKRKIAEKRKRSSNLKSTRAEKSATKRVRKYLSAKFTRNLVDHMHQAKKVALQGKE